MDIIRGRCAFGIQGCAIGGAQRHILITYRKAVEDGNRNERRVQSSVRSGSLVFEADEGESTVFG